jgi:hypothetical protein
VSVDVAKVTGYVVHAPGEATGLGVSKVMAYVVTDPSLSDYVPPARRRRRVFINI